MSNDATPRSGKNAASRKSPPTNAEKWAARLSLVNEIARSAHAKLEMGDLLNTVVETIHKHFGYYDVSIFLVDAEAGDCVLVAQSGEFDAQGIEGYRQKIGVGLVGWVAEHGETVVANDLRNEPRRIVAFEGESKFLSGLTVPVRLRNRTVGVINIQNCEPNVFDDCDVMALETLSGQLAQAIANAQLFERTRLLRDLNRGIIDAMPSGLCVLDKALRVLYANPSFCTLFGESVENINGREFHEVLSTAVLDESSIEEALNAALQHGEPRVLTDVEMECGGMHRALNVRVAPAHMPEGAGVLIVFEDVTQWREAMNLAEERRSQIDLIVKHVPIAVVAFDLEGGITYWGAGAEELFGHAEEEMLGKGKPNDLFEDGAAFQTLVEACRANNSAEGQLFIVRKDAGRTPILAVLGKLFDRDDLHVGYTAVVLDITEGNRVQEELLREKQKLDDVVGVIGAGLALIDRDRKVVWANPTIIEWFGRGGSVEGRHCYELYFRRESRCATCPVDRCFAEGGSNEAEMALTRADGELRQYHQAVTPVTGPSGEVEQVLMLTLDVTDQTKKVYQLSRLRQLGELMQGLLDLDRLLYYVLTCVTAGQALGFNRAVLMLVDRDRDIIEGKMGVGPGSAEEAARIWSRLTEEAPTLEDLLSHYDKDNGKAPTGMDRIAQTIRVSLDDPSHILVECALGKRTIVVNDAENDPRVHKDFRQLLGSRQFVLVPLIARNRPVAIIMADNLYSGQPISDEHVELLRMFANQAAIAIENAENYKALQEEKIHLEKAYRDLADAQDKLVRSERLVAIGRMSAHVAHEIRNPLVTIGGFAKIVQERPDARHAEVAHYAQIIASEAQRLENILARVMDFSRPPRPLLQETSLGRIVTETLEQFRDRAEVQHIEIQCILPHPDVTLPLDPEQIKQVLINLIRNAFDGMKDGGKLTFRVEMQPKQIALSIINTGELIRPEDMPNIFEPFFSTKPGGTGLGLAVSQKIVQEHGGDIRVLSTLEGGTEFTITLPHNKAINADSPPHGDA